ncbi:putative copia-type protein, partial [Trifolium pratense]
MTPHREWLTCFDASKKSSIRLADGRKLVAEGIGQLVQKGFLVNMEDNALKLFDKMKNLILMCNLSKNRTYRCKISSVDMMCISTTVIDEVEELWHKRYGHLNFRSLSELNSKELVYGVPKINVKHAICDICIKSKQSRLPFVKEMTKRACVALEVIHSDICGPFEVPSLSGSKYFITFVDEYTRMLWLYTIKFKREALDVFKRFKVLIEKESDKSIKILRTDVIVNKDEKSKRETDPVHKDEVQYNHIYLDSSDESDGEEGYEEVEPVNGDDQNQCTNHEVDMHISSDDDDDRIHLSARPQRIKHVPARLNDCEVTHDSAVNDEGELIHFALLADSELVNFRDALKMIICLYVYDLLITGSKASEIEELECKLKSEFEMTDLGKLSYFLGMEFVKVQDGIVRHQQKYINELLEKFEMNGCNSISNPSERNTKLDECSNEEKVDSTMFGTLRYVCNSRPDICYSISVISKFMHDPRKSQLAAAKKIF